MSKRTTRRPNAPLLGQTRGAIHAERLKALYGIQSVKTMIEGVTQLQETATRLKQRTAAITKARQQQKNKMLIDRTPNGQYFVYPFGKGPTDGIACSTLDEIPKALSALYAACDQEEAMDVERPADEELQ